MISSKKLDIKATHFCRECRKWIKPAECKGCDFLVGHLQQEHKISTIEDYLKAHKNAQLFYENNEDEVLNENENVLAPIEIDSLDVPLEIIDNNSKKKKNKTVQKNDFYELKEFTSFLVEIPDSPLKSIIFFLCKQTEDMIIEYNKKFKEKGVRDYNLQRIIKENLKEISSNISTLGKHYEKTRDEVDAVRLHNETINEAEMYIKTHIGEFAFAGKCDICDKEIIVGTLGLPHWALKRDRDNHGFYIWSRELYKLFCENKIDLAEMAYILQTSPINIIETAKTRHNDLKLDNKIKDFVIDAREILSRDGITDEIKAKDLALKYYIKNEENKLKTLRE